jgi:hypothetical protein
MDEFIRGQRANLDQVRPSPLFRELIGALDAGYHAAVDCLPKDGVPIIFGRILLICHKSMLSAATLVAQGQPEDSTGVTRRALEAAKVALAIKINDANALQWTAYQERHDRWLRRQQNQRPGPFAVQFSDVRGDALMERINTQIGILSDASVHFTPEFYSSLDWEVNRTTDGQGEIYLNYFQRSQREIERQLIALSAAHLTILDVLNRCCDGRFQEDEHCREQLGEFVRIGRTSTQFTSASTEQPTKVSH